MLRSHTADSPSGRVNGAANGRRTHRKSRTGCISCKARKVKCDETRPTCHNCIKHDITCEYKVSRPNALLASQGLSPSPATISSQSIAHGEINAMGVTEMELLHHFSTSTCYTMARNPLLQTVWRVKGPQLGFDFLFVLRGILAIAALHLSYLRPDRQEFYVNQATDLQNRALREVNSILPHVTTENCSALYLFSALTCIISFAKPRDRGNFLLVEEGGISEWVLFFRGSKTIIDHASGTLETGPLAPMFSVGKYKVQLREMMSTELQPCLLNLMRSLEQSGCDSNTLQIYTEAINELSKSFTSVLDSGSQSSESADVFMWLFRISDEYLQLLNERNPEALVILAYFCVVLKQLEWTWWVSGWSRYLISELHRVLDEEHRSWIQWPMEQIGWAP